VGLGDHFLQFRRRAPLFSALASNQGSRFGSLSLTRTGRAGTKQPLELDPNSVVLPPRVVGDSNSIALDAMRNQQPIERVSTHHMVVFQDHRRGLPLRAVESGIAWFNSVSE
jgi:hypothetical protein